MIDQNWISTGAALRIMNLGISRETFRTKFIDYLPWRRTPGGHIRWLEEAVQRLAAEKPKQNAKIA